MDKIKTIIMTRHGSTEMNEKGVWQGQGDFPLNEKGTREAELLAEELKSTPFDLVIHSPMKRTLQTAQIATKYQPSPVFKAMNCFIEMNLGEFEGKKHTDIIASHSNLYDLWQNDSDTLIPGGESYRELFQRVKPGVDEILELPYENILIVAHAMVNRALLGHFLKMDMDTSRKFRTDNCSYSRLFVYHTAQGTRSVVVDTWNNIHFLK